MPSKSITFYLLLFVCIAMSCNGPKEEPVSEVPTTIGLTSVQKIDRQIEANPEKPELYLERGDLFYELEGFDEAIADYKKVIELDSSRVEAHSKLAQTYLEYDNSRLALLTLEAATYQFPSDIDLLHKLAEYKIILEQNNEAFLTLKRATKLDRFNPRSYYLMGINFEDTDDVEKAIRSYKVAVDKDADFIPALMRLGFLHEEKEDPKAIQYFDAAISAEPDNFRAHLAKGNNLGQQGKFNEAIEVFKGITNQGGVQQSAAFFNIGLSYFQLDSLNEAKKHFEITTSVDPTYGLAYFFLGEIAKGQDDIETAKKFYQQAASFEDVRNRAEQALEALK